MVAVFGARLEPLPCPTCDGEKEIQFKTCTCSGKCPCDTRWTKCPGCLATPGFLPCRVCKEAPAIGPDSDGDLCCEVCLKSEADEQRGAA